MKPYYTYGNWQKYNLWYGICEPPPTLSHSAFLPIREFPTNDCLYIISVFGIKNLLFVEWFNHETNDIRNSSTDSTSKNVLYEK